MAFKSTKTLLWLRVIFLAALIFSACYLWIKTDLVIIPVLLTVLALFMVYRITRLIERSENNFFNFLNAVKYFDLIYLENIGNKRTNKKYRDLYEEVIGIFRKLKSEKEINFENLQNIIKNIDAGIICFDHSGKIELINPSALALLNKPLLTHINVLQNFDPDLYELIMQIRSGENRLQKRIIKNKISSLNIQAKEFKIRGVYHKLIIIQDFKDELDSHEIESYRKLISVLTHEIMNSMTPVISLAEVIESGLTEEKLEALKSGRWNEEEMEEIRMGAKIISNRSKNLLKFVQTYRNLTKIPQPQPEVMSLSELMEKIEQLFRPQMLHDGVTWKLEKNASEFQVVADPALIEQVVINLIKNALEALKAEDGQKSISVVLYTEADRTYMDITDTGIGMNAETLEHIFVPFFTTKMQGSGIGLSLSKQIMRMHGGNIYVRSVEQEGSSFTLEF